MTERRHGPRVLIRRAVDVYWDKGRAMGWARDICESGMFVETKELLELGTGVHVTVHFRRSPKLSVAAEVCRSAPEGLALRFCDVSPSASQAISKVVGRV